MLPPTVDWEVLTRYLAGETTEEENREVELWEASNAANRRQLSQLRKIWQASGSQTEAPETNVDLALQEITRKLNFAPTEYTLPKLEAKSDYSWVWKVAAVLVLSLGVVFAIFRNKTGVQDLGVAYVKYETEPGRQTKITLPDNSIVWLNGGSSLRYPKTFAANSREVQLTGEAFFDVAKDASKPFRITAAETVTEVKGTSFNVEAYTEQQDVIVSVVTGKVELREEDKPENRVLLTPDQTGKFNAETHQVISEPTSDLNFMAWQTRVLRFQNTDLKTVARDLEKVYGKKIRFRNQKLENCHFTGTFEKQTLEEIQEVLRLTLNLTFTEENGTVWIAGEGC
ncbi:FecR domain-containing protein [Adhaeribacter sp. BT258]|uniref:FecR domain-containing protein n=1 Tax=Adhaeribacter terrigena TaxID=2793070 RepID=A0ABS1C2Y9_9BACT|nr:FecR domain-containing protein [Adhaeribacter terrigena]MBK0403506.1 FecR domain-containing protein [Adhaeribacter terrigena]